MRSLVVLFCLLTLAASGRSQAAGLRIGYLYPAIEYDSENSLRWIAGQMESKHGARSFFFRGKDVDEGSNQANPTIIPNLSDLDSLDILVIFVRRVWLNPEQTQRLKAFLDAGKGLVGIRSACHAIESWDSGRGIDSAIWGGVYNGHGAKNGYDLEFTAEAAVNPIFKDVHPWRAGNSLYFQNYLGRSVAKDVNVLMYGKTGEGRFPVAWTRLRKGSNIFFTSTGDQGDFQNADFRKMILNAVLWSGHALSGPTSVPGVAQKLPWGGKDRAGGGNRIREHEGNMRTWKKASDPEATYLSNGRMTAPLLHQDAFRFHQAG